MDKKWWLNNQNQIHGKEEVEHEHEEAVEEIVEEAVEEIVEEVVEEVVEEAVEEVVEEAPKLKHGVLRNDGQEFWNAKEGAWYSIHNNRPV